MPLFDRLGRRVTLTDAGRHFQPFAEQALVAMEQGQRAIRTAPSPAVRCASALLKASSPIACPRCCASFAAAFLWSSSSFGPTSVSLCSRLEAGKIDHCHRHVRPTLNRSTKRLAAFGTSFPFRRTQAFSRHHGEPSSPPTWQARTLLLTEVGCGYRAKLDRALALQNVRAGNVTESPAWKPSRNVSASAWASACCPKSSSRAKFAQNLFRALHWTGPSLDITTHVIWHKDKWISPAMAAFLELLQSQVNDTPDRDASSQLLCSLIAAYFQDLRYFFLASFARRWVPRSLLLGPGKARFKWAHGDPAKASRIRKPSPYSLSP